MKAEPKPLIPLKPKENFIEFLIVILHSFNLAWFLNVHVSNNYALSYSIIKQHH